MSYGTMKRAAKRITCYRCGRKDDLSPIQFELYRVTVGRKNRYLCGECYWNKSLLKQGKTPVDRLRTQGGK